MGLESEDFNNDSIKIAPETEKIEEYEYTGKNEDYNYFKYTSKDIWEMLQKAKNKKEVDLEEINKLQTQLDNVKTKREKSWIKQQEKLAALDPQVSEEYKNIKSKLWDVWREELLERDRTHKIDTKSKRVKDIYELESKRRELEQKYKL